jgi:prolyl oligopeptidase
MYRDNYSKYGQLTYEMWRAIRLVVDTGIHAFGWSREQAINFFKDNSAKTINDISVEIDRYIAWPGQALAYKTGELKFKELKNKAKNVLAEKFDIRQFHDLVLSEGAVPLSVLQKMVDDWLEKNNSH